MTTQYDSNNESPTEIELDQNDQNKGRLIEQAASFSLNQQQELPVNFSQRNLVADDSSSNNSMDIDENINENNIYIQHARDSDMDFPIFREEFENNRWSETYNKTNKFFVRKQTRNYSETDMALALQELISLNNSNNDEEEIYYNATSWTAGIEKVENGPRKSKGPLDMAYYGAFYLNPSYHDCHDWFKTADSKFKGKYAMLIYKFYPEQMSSKGKRVLSINQWKSLAGERSRHSGKFEDDWIYTYQCINPKGINKSGDNARIRVTRNGEHAMQLIIYTDKMFRKIHQHLIGCIYYENCSISKSILEQN